MKSNTKDPLDGSTQVALVLTTLCHKRLWNTLCTVSPHRSQNQEQMKSAVAAMINLLSPPTRSMSAST